MEQMKSMKTLFNYIKIGTIYIVVLRGGLGSRKFSAPLVNAHVLGLLGTGHSRLTMSDEDEGR